MCLHPVQLLTQPGPQRCLTGSCLELIFTPEGARSKLLVVSCEQRFYILAVPFHNSTEFSGEACPEIVRVLESTRRALTSKTNG